MLGIPLELWTIVIDYVKKDRNVINIGSVNQYLYYLTLSWKQFIVTETNYEIFFPVKTPFCRIQFNDNFNMDLDKLCIPCELSSLSVVDLLKSVNSDEFIDLQKKLQLQLFPDSLTHLTFGYRFNQKIEKLPDGVSLNQKTGTKSQFSDFASDPSALVHSGVTHLKFGYHFNQKIEKLPDDLTHLTFGREFNQEIEKLPDGLTHLTFGREFNQEIEKLPDGLTHLEFGHYFNQKIEKLPDGLTHLTFGEYYDQKVKTWPDNLTHLTFGYFFNQNIDNLPDSVTHLAFGWNFNQKIKQWPSNLRYLKFSNYYKKIDNLPKSLQILEIYYVKLKLFSNIPSGTIVKFLDSKN